jgi:two-component system cell cycle sensor histidine kinase/response regulator CckA
VVTVSQERAALHAGASGGRHVCLTVADTGCGISPETLPRIFEPFFTTKEVGRGTGLGLATVFGIVEQHQGWIEVDSLEGEGTSFKVFLPALSRAALPAGEAEASADAPGGHETILLVEDEPAVRALTRTVLERYGYRVIEAETAVAALARWEREPMDVDLLLTDLVMPGGMSGRDLAEELVTRAPRLRVMYTSGYTAEVVGRLLRLDPGVTLLQKPCTALQLATTVRKCLDRGR